MVREEVIKVDSREVVDRNGLPVTLEDEEEQW